MSRTQNAREVITPIFAMLAIFAITWGSSAYAQRQHFPSPMTVNVAPPASATAPGSPPPPTYNPGTYNANPYSPPSYNPPSYNPAPAAASPYGQPAYNSAPAMGPAMGPGPVPVTGGSVLGPTGSPSLPGSVQLPPPQWDPYAPPGPMQQPMLLPEDPYLPGSPTESIVKMRRLVQDIRLDYTFLSATGTKKFGTNDLGLNVTFAFPFFYNQESPLLVTPGFTFHWWQGGYLQQQPEYALPPRVYDAYLSSAWNPQITPWLGGELQFCVGVYSDFSKKLTTEALRYTGRGLFVLSFSPTMKIKAGVIYYDRVKIKILPAGGLIWTPSPDTRFDIFFPEPRFAKRLTVVGNTEWWYYLRGEYGGGSWAFAWTGLAGEPVYQADYNDIRVAMGLEFDRLNVLDGHIEFGVAVNREIIPNGPIPDYKPSTTFFLGAGLAY